jgi:hypothetical protein
MGRSGPRYSEAEARSAIAASRSYAEALRRLGMRPAGGNHTTLKRYALDVWRISTAHFDPAAVRDEGLRRARSPTPLAEILVEHSTYSRNHLKGRLYAEGVKRRVCELCGQGETWRGRKMSLILDHVNGCATDNRIENLRIVCPNCAATLDTHCGKMLRRLRTERLCDSCGELFYPSGSERRFCSHSCWVESRRGLPLPDLRRVERPPYEVLLREIAALGYLAVGRRYGVSDNAIRKWVRQYERERSRDGPSADLSDAA